MENFLGMLRRLPKVAVLGIVVLAVMVFFAFSSTLTSYLRATVFVDDGAPQFNGIELQPANVEIAPGKNAQFSAFAVTGENRQPVRVQWSITPDSLGSLNCGVDTTACLFTAGNKAGEGTVTVLYGDYYAEAKIAIVGEEIRVYQDVAAGDWFYEAVMKLRDLSFLSEKTSAFFPSDGAIRADFVLLNYRLLQLLAADFANNVSPDSCAFADMPADHYARNAVCAFAALGWVSGNTDGDFAPNQAITREQAAKIVFSSLSSLEEWPEIFGSFGSEELPDYSDVNSENWSYESVMALTKVGVFTRDDSGGFHPEKSLSRAEMAVIFARVYDLVVGK